MGDQSDITQKASQLLGWEGSEPCVPDHEIIRRIGSGAYGEVWLARNVMGTYRAVKVVYRERFDDITPYRREFNGIEKYEPVSRAAPSLLDILQIGEGVDGSYFYYVMELADDALAPDAEKRSEDGSTTTVRKQTIGDPENYVPETLSRVLYDRHTLPVSECVSIGLSLTRALGFLHENGLVHRDVKPSNIIFVNGEAKLADIGLIAETSEAHTMVGTQGFIAPEGPNSAQGDIFSLGKVLYEACTGKDRQQFPEPPSLTDSREDTDQMLELNAVILKASEHDAERRYASMDEMRSDLELIQEGKSVRRARLRKLRARQLKRALQVTVVAAAIVAAGAILYRRTNSPPAAPTYTQLATPTDGIYFNVHRERQFDFSPDGRAMAFPSKGRIAIWEQTAGITRKTDLDPDGWRWMEVRFSPDGTLIAGRGYKPLDPAKPSGDRLWTVLLTRTDDPIAQKMVDPSPHQISPPYWMPDGAGVTVHSSEGRIDVFLDGRVEHMPEIRFGKDFFNACQSPDGKWIAGVRNSKRPGEALGKDIWIIPSTGGRAIQVTDWPGLDAHPTWSHDGKSLYYVSSEGSPNRESWNIWEIELSPTTGAPQGEARQITRFVDAYAMFPKIVGDGRKMTFATRKQTDILTSAIDRDGELDQVRAIARGFMGSISPDGEFAYFIGQTPEQIGLYRVPFAGGRPVEIVGGNTVALARPTVASTYSVSPDGQAIAFSGTEEGSLGIYCVDSEGGNLKKLAQVASHENTVPRWSPDGELIAYADGGTLYVVRPNGGGRAVLSTVYRWQPWTVLWSPDGSHVALLGYESPEEWDESVAVFVVSRDGSETRRLTPAEETEYKEGLSWHPDGERLTYMRYGPGAYGAENRWAFLDGRPTQTFIDMPGRWDYVGRWAPDGNRFYFGSFGDDAQTRFVKRLSTGQIDPVSAKLESPQWDNDGKHLVWENSQTQHLFWIMEGF